MELSFASSLLAFVAGGLSTLSPCVLPLLPLVAGSAFCAHRFGVFSLALGLALSFTLLGVLVASAGNSLGFDPSVIKTVGALLLVVFGIVLLSPALQEKFTNATSRIGSSGHEITSRFDFESLGGQFFLGLVLGIVWSPCVGPTLGAAITLASQKESLLHVGVTMAIFGLGASTPLLVMGLLSREVIARLRPTLLSAGKNGKKILGGLMLFLGITLLFGYDKAFEAYILGVAPEWLIALTTSI